HPNLFDPRPTVSPFIDHGFTYCIPSLVNSVLDYHPLSQIDLRTLNIVFSHLSTALTHFGQSTLYKLQCNSSQMERMWNGDSHVYVRLTDFTGFHRFIDGIKVISGSMNGTNKKIIQLKTNQIIRTF